MEKRRKNLEKWNAEEGISKLRAEIDLNKGEQDVNKEDTCIAALDKYGLVSLQTIKEQELAIIQYHEDKAVLSHDEAMRARRQIDQEYLDGLTADFAKANDR